MGLSVASHLPALHHASRDAAQCRPYPAQPQELPPTPRPSPGLSIASHIPTQQPAAHLSDVHSTAHLRMHFFVYHQMVNTTGENPVKGAKLNTAFLPQLITLIYDLPDHNKYVSNVVVIA